MAVDNITLVAQERAHERDWYQEVSEGCDTRTTEIILEIRDRVSYIRHIDEEAPIWTGIGIIIAFTTLSLYIAVYVYDWQMFAAPSSISPQYYKIFIASIIIAIFIALSVLSIRLSYRLYRGTLTRARENLRTFFQEPVHRTVAERMVTQVTSIPAPKNQVSTLVRALQY